MTTAGLVLDAFSRAAYFG
jgi:hypothetical protein